MNWINDDIKIDFEVPKLLQSVIDEIEEADRSGDAPEYAGLAKAVDNVAKNFINCGKITHKQWDIICERYPQNA